MSDHDPDKESNTLSSLEPETPPTAAIDTAHLAMLARLRLTAAGEREANADLSRIIHMIDAMQNIDTDGVTPMAHPLDATQRLRADEVTETVDPTVFQAHAPETADGYYLVPRVVE